MNPYKENVSVVTIPKGGYSFTYLLESGMTKDAPIKAIKQDCLHSAYRAGKLLGAGICQMLHSILNAVIYRNILIQVILSSVGVLW